MSVKRKSILILSSIFIMHSVLVSTHLGEFWPFSIYPMFSQAGKTWTRSLVRDVSNEDQRLFRETQNKFELSGDPFPLDSLGVHQNDLSNFVSKNMEWTHAKKNAIRFYFNDYLDSKSFLIYKVSGDLNNGKVTTSYTPYIYLSNDTTIVIE